ncbi:MAG TPA: GAF domain-containing protein [Stellaceae bacterium]|nr:GAF domain-containing protein [Stellaceae bacterium]
MDTPGSTLADLQKQVADLGRQLAEARAERDEALAQQTATAEVLGVINSSPGDLAPVFDAMIERATRICEASFGGLLTWDGERFHRVAFHGVPSELIRQTASEPLAPVPGSLAERFVRGEQVIAITDLGQSDAFRVGAGAQALVRFGKARSYVGVALRKDERLLGAITIYRQEVRPFTEKQIALLQNFAAQAVIAIENARLLTETREALDQQTATAGVLGVINSSPGDLAPVFDAMLESALRLCDVSFGFLVTIDGERLRVAASRNLPDKLADYLNNQELRLDPRTLLGRAVLERRTIHTEDNANTEGYREGVPLVVTTVEIAGIRTTLHVPLIRDDRVLGVLIFFRQEVRPFSDKQIALLQNFATQAVIAIENARLLTETREALEQQTATAEVLRVINSSPGDLASVFDAILEKAHSLCGIASGTLQLYDREEKFHAEAVHGLPEKLADFLRQGYHSGPNLPQTRLIAGEARAHVTDLAEVDDPDARTAVELGNIRTIFCVALRKDSDLLGFISAARFEVRPFSEKEIAILEGFATQAVIAMENARLLGELRQRTEEVAELNRGLEARVAEQVEELGRVGRLKRFLAPQLAELIVSQGDEKILESHRREIVVVFCDLRGYTAFTETAEPEEVLDFLREYHGALGPLVSQFEGTLDQFSGDGIMVFFNDPVPIADPAERAVRMAVAMREVAGELIAAWRRRDRDLGFGAGIAQGYATLGQIGFAERSGYTAIGTVCNLAARLCADAKDGQILISGRVAAAIEKAIPLEDLGSLALKGLSQPVSAFNVPLAANQQTLRVIEGGPPSG